MTFQVMAGDCREVMATLEAESVEAIVTDPPYELGFMGKSWDASGVAFDPETWRHALRVLKPGGHLLAFSGSRTYHRMACAIEDAGFEIRDQIMWVYGSGFPKSHDVSKAIDREAGAEREVVGTISIPGDQLQRMSGSVNSDENKWTGIKLGEPVTDAARTWSGWGTALKPAHEPIVVARKPFKGTVAANVMAHGTGALNIDGCRVDSGPSPSVDRRKSGAPKMEASMFRDANHKHDREAYEQNRPGEHLGRWPANFIHDGSDEAVAGLGEAARYFYVPKASKRDREDGLRDAGVGALRDAGRPSEPRRNHHPTVKPTDLMRYLCRLVTPPGGLVLDPFAGSGSTGRGAVLEGFRFVGIEMDAGYTEIAIARIESAERSSHGAS